MRSSLYVPTNKSHGLGKYRKRKGISNTQRGVPTMRHALSGSVLSDINPYRAAVPFWGQTTQNLSGVSPKRDCGMKPPRQAHAYDSGALIFAFWGDSLELFRTGVPRREQTTQHRSSLSQSGTGVLKGPNMGLDTSPKTPA